MSGRRRAAAAGGRQPLQIVCVVATILWIAIVLMVVLHLRPQPEMPRWFLRQPRAAMLPPAGLAVTLPQGEISVNSAEVDELMKLPGVGPVLAEAIVSERQQNGLFYYPEDLLNVRGIGEKTLEKLLPYVNFQ